VEREFITSGAVQTREHQLRATEQDIDRTLEMNLMKCCDARQKVNDEITKIETLVCHARMRNWIFCQSPHDQPGSLRLGEATLEWHTRAGGAIEDIAQFFGEDPTRVEHLWQMSTATLSGMATASARTAISGIDIALWDIVGKIHGVPVHNSGRAGPRLHPALLSSRRRQDGRVLRYRPRRRPTFLVNSPSKRRGGFHGVQEMAVPETMPIEGLARSGTPRVWAAMREAVGDDIDIMVDCPRAPSPRMGLLFCEGARTVQISIGLKNLAGRKRWTASRKFTSRQNSHCDRRTSRGNPRVPGTPRKARRQHSATGHHALRRPERSATDRRDGEAYRVALAPHNPQGRSAPPPR